MLILFISLIISCNKSTGNADRQSLERDSLNADKITLNELKKSSKKGTEDDSPYNQISIKFDNQSGVPHYFDERLYGHMIHGFEVDEEGLLYFFGGEPTTLVCFKENRQLYRVAHSEISPSQLHSYSDTLYIFDNFYERNNLFSINRKNGELIKASKNITDNRINNYHFQDSLLVLNLFNLDESVNIDSEMYPIAYDLNGLMLKELPNIYGIRENYKREEDGEYMGKWKGHNLFWSLTGANSDEYRFDLQDDKGNTIHSKILKEAMFGEALYGMEGNPQEHRKLCNGNVYVLGRKGDNAVITILRLVKLFPEI